MASLHNASEPVSINPQPVDQSNRIIRTNSDDGHNISPSPHSQSSSESESALPKHMRAQRPKLPTRKSSGTIIISRDANVQSDQEDYGPEDARTMSPRRTSEEVDRLGENAREALMQQAKELQESLLQIVERVESVKSDHEKLQGENRFLQSYIGELMQTSKLTTSSFASKSKGKGKSSK